MSAVIELNSLPQMREMSLLETFHSLTAEVLPKALDASGRICLNVHLWGDFVGKFGSVEGHTRTAYEPCGRVGRGELFKMPLPECDYYMYVPDDFRNIGGAVAREIEIKFKLAGFVWISYMSPGIEFRWHADTVDSRFHYILKNAGVDPGIQFESGKKIFMREGHAYVFCPREKHCVPLQRHDRIHLVATIEAPSNQVA